MRITVFIAITLMFISSNLFAFDKQSELNDFAEKTTLQFSVISNFNNDGKFTGELQINNHSNIALPNGTSNWKIYFHSIRKLDTKEIDGVNISHLKGDLHCLTPSKSFAGLSPGNALNIPYVGANWIVSYTDFMPRAFIVVEGLEPEIFSNTNTEEVSDFVSPLLSKEQQLRQPEDHYPIATAQSRFEVNAVVNKQAINPSAISDRIFPTPKNVIYSNGSVVVDLKWKIHADTNSINNAQFLQKTLIKQVGLELAITTNKSKYDKLIFIGLDETIKSPESYRLEITPGKITITGSDAAGVFYGVQSLLSLLPVNITHQRLKLPLLVAVDSPRFSWRGMHYDMARNFHGKEVTLRLIDQMARFKLNKLHMHITDDEGWRLQIPGLPELTSFGANRCFDLMEQTCLLTQLGTGPNKKSTGNGYYSRQDFIEILQYAADRHIEVIPEIDMPGHSRAAIKSMQARYQQLNSAGKPIEAEQYLLSDILDKSTYLTVQNYNDNSLNVCQESSYVFIDKVVDEIALMYEQAGISLKVLHVGGDEVGKGSWLGSPNCQKLMAHSKGGIKSADDLKFYFVKRLSAILQQKDIALAGWEDGLMFDATTPFNRSQLPNKRIIANVWDNIWEWGVADRAYRLANDNYQVVLSHATHLYFDHPQEASPFERGYYWATRYTDNQKIFNYMPDNVYANADKTRMGDPIIDLEKTVGRPLPALQNPSNIIGMQGNVWSETIRTSEQLEQMIYPRMLMVAERAWHKASWEGENPDTSERDLQWAEIANLLAVREIPKLQQQGSAVYLPPPGVTISDGKAIANTSLPGLAISYSLDEGKTWNEYMQPVQVNKGSICFRSHAIESTFSRVQCTTEIDRLNSN